MYSQLLIAALAASVSASVAVPGHFPMRRELQNLARQTTESATLPSGTSASDADCQLMLVSLAENIPTPAPALESYAESYSAADPCSYSVPNSLSSQWNDYSSSLYSWYSASSVAIYSVVSECPEYADEAASALFVCSTAVTGLFAGSTGASSAGSSATATGSASGSSAAGSSATSSSESSSSSGSSSSSSPTGTASGSSASASASGSGASAREVGIVGAVLAGVLGLAVAL